MIFTFSFKEKQKSLSQHVSELLDQGTKYAEDNVTDKELREWKKVSTQVLQRRSLQQKVYDLEEEYESFKLGEGPKIWHQAKLAMGVFL